MKNETTKVTFDIPKAHHKKLKANAASSGKSMKSIMLDALECATSFHMPNEKTIKAILDAKKRKNLLNKDEARELSKKLGL